MKTIKILVPLCVGLFLLVALSFRIAKEDIHSNSKINPVEVKYTDGTYKGFSRSKYTNEPFWGQVTILVENGKFKKINFEIRDTILHESVDSMYGVIHYSGNSDYIQQCVNDGNGIKNYPVKLLKTQDINKVDAVSGATWSYNIFKESVKEALK